jgi:hypothetical protein
LCGALATTPGGREFSEQGATTLDQQSVPAAELTAGTHKNEWVTKGADIRRVDTEGVADVAQDEPPARRDTHVAGGCAEGYRRVDAPCNLATSAHAPAHRSV